MKRIHTLALALMTTTTVAFAMNINSNTLVSLINAPDKYPGVTRKPSSVQSLQVNAWIFEKKNMFEGVLLYRAKNNPKAWILHVEQSGELSKKGLDALVPGKKALFTHIEQYVTPYTYYLVTAGPLKGSYLMHKEWVGQDMVSYSLESSDFETEVIKAIKADPENPIAPEDLKQLYELHHYLTAKTEFCRTKLIKCL